MDPNANYVPLIYMMYNIMEENPKIIEVKKKKIFNFYKRCLLNKVEQTFY